MKRNYEIFISYSRRDTAVVDEICRALDRAGVSYFIDRQENPDDMEIPATLADAIVGSRVFLLIASENSYASKFVNAEITFAFNKLPRRSIVPYIIDGSELPLSMRFIFASINWRDMRTHPIEPKLVADLCGILGRVVPVEARTVDPDFVSHFEIGKGHDAGVVALAMSRTADILASGAADGTVCLWDLFMGERKGEPFRLDGGGEITSVSLNADGHMLAASDYSVTEVWNTDTHELLFSGKGSNVAFSPDGSMMAMTGRADVQVYSTADFSLINSFELPLWGQYQSLSALAFLPDNKAVAVGDSASHVWVRDCLTGDDVTGCEVLELSGAWRISALAITPDGRKVLAASALGVNCWTLPGGVMQSFPSDDVVESVSVSPDSRYFATADYMGVLKLYDIEERSRVFERRIVNVNRVLFSPDGEFMASGDIYGVVGVWPLKYL